MVRKDYNDLDECGDEEDDQPGFCLFTLRLSQLAVGAPLSFLPVAYLEVPQHSINPSIRDLELSRE